MKNYNEKQTEFILKHFDTVEDFQSTLENVGGDVKKMIDGGCFQISYYDQMGELEELGLLSENEQETILKAEEFGWNLDYHSIYRGKLAYFLTK